MSKSLVAFVFAGLSIASAMPLAAQAPTVSLVAPADVAANPANRLNIQLSNGGTVVIHGDLQGWPGPLYSGARRDSCRSDNRANSEWPAAMIRQASAVRDLLAG